MAILVWPYAPQHTTHHTHTHRGIQGPGEIAPDLTHRIEKMARKADLIALKKGTKKGVLTSDKAKGRLLELRNAQKFRHSIDAIRSPRLRSMDNGGEKLPSFTDILSATDEEKKAEKGRKKAMKLHSGFTSPRGQVHSPRGGEGGSTEEGKGTDIDGDSSELTAVDEMDDDDAHTGSESSDVVHLREALTTPRGEKEKGHHLSVWLDGAVSDEAVEHANPVFAGQAAGQAAESWPGEEAMISATLRSSAGEESGVVEEEVAPRESKSTPAFVSTKSTLVSYYATRHLGEDVAEEVVPGGVAARTRTRSQASSAPSTDPTDPTTRLSSNSAMSRAQDDAGGRDEWTEADSTFDARHGPNGSYTACLANTLSPVHEEKTREYDAYDDSDGGSVAPGGEAHWRGGSVITDNLHDGSSYDGESSELSSDPSGDAAYAAAFALAVHSDDTVVDNGGNGGNSSTYEKFKKKAEDVSRGIVSGDGVGAAHMAAMFTTPPTAVVSPEGSYLSETSESFGRYSPRPDMASYMRSGEVEGVAVTPSGSTVLVASIVHGYNLDR